MNRAEPLKSAKAMVKLLATQLEVGNLPDISCLGFVAVNHENDTCFGNGLVMGSADCLYYAGLVKTPEKLFLALCQTHCKQLPVFSCLSGYHVIT